MNLNTLMASQTLWQQCEGLYFKTGIMPFCLQLQEKGANVNITLLALRLFQRGLRLTEAQWLDISNLGQNWDNLVVAPFRAERKKRKAHLSTLQYQKMISHEVMLERVLQRRISVYLTRLDKTPHKRGVVFPAWLLAYQAEIKQLLNSIDNS